ncbi:MAG: 16S rRNA (guanine(527)-N(7))-methyltransferase RsmG [Bacteroidota bacterium]
MDLLLHYFPELSTEQRLQFIKAAELYAYWNQRINVISRKDIEAIHLHHFLHALAIAKAFPLQSGRVLDFGTGGGFPGIPLAIFYPALSFHLVDSIGKKIKVVQEIISDLGLLNVTASNERVEQHIGTYDYITCRAVAPLPELYQWTKNLHNRKSEAEHNGWILLKGGDLHQEISDLGKRVHIRSIRDYFQEDYFQNKFVLHFK